jgi:hypothetical protein
MEFGCERTNHDGFEVAVHGILANYNDGTDLANLAANGWI